MLGKLYSQFFLMIESLHVARELLITISGIFLLVASFFIS